MKFPCRTIVLLVACVALMNPALAGDWTVGVETSFDRAPDDFNEPSATKILMSAARTLATGVIVGGSFEPQIKAHSHELSYNLETTFGYVWRLSHFASLGGFAGVGERFQRESSGGDFPYYVMRVRYLDERWSWNLITYRFRDAFNTENDFNTPEVSCGIALKIDDRRSVSAKYYYAWKDSTPDNQGIRLVFNLNF